MKNFEAATDGSWPQILCDLGGVDAARLVDQHGPCPACGGKDRFRWDDNGGPGAFFCNQCGGKDRAGGGGNGLDLLMRVTGWDFKEAVKNVERHLGIEKGSPTPRKTPVKKTSKPSKPARIPERPPADVIPPALDGASASWAYRDADGEILFYIQRVDLPRGGKLFVHRTWIDGDWHRPSKKDPFTSDWPAPRPLYRLDQLALKPWDDVVIVEGEKTADAAARLLPDYPVLSWPNGSNAIDKVDWQPLAGRFVHLWPDNDEPGFKAMNKIAKRLHALGCNVKIITPPAHMPKGWDLADAPWTAEETADFLAGNTRLYEPTQNQETSDASQPDEIEATENRWASHFVLLGHRGEDYYYLPVGTGAITRLSAYAHNTTGLCRIAPLEFWKTLYEGPRGGVDWAQAVSDLFTAQHDVGEFNPDYIRGRGAWWDQSRSVLHLGDRLIVDGIERPISEQLESRYHYQKGVPLARLHGVEPLSDVDSLRVLELCERFYWEMPASALLLSGWCFLAPICGVLPWRPHLWLTAAAGTGKTAILERFVAPLLGDLHLNTQGSTTEAYIRQTLRTDALPVVMDEAESNQRSDAARMQSILALARQASSESRSVQGRGSAKGEAQTYRIRSMFLLASVATAVKLGADDRRFAQLTLRKPPKFDPDLEAEKWLVLKSDLEKTLDEKTCLRLLARAISLIPKIRASIAVFNRVCAAHFGTQAAGDQYGTLLAGAHHLMSSEVATEQDVMGMLNGVSWETYTENVDVLPDEQACLKTILQHKVRFPMGQERTVFECLNLSDLTYDKPGEPVTSKEATDALGRLGIRLKDGRVCVSNIASGMAAILADTPWGTSWSTMLRRLPDAASGGMVHFSGIGSSRCVTIPVDLETGSC